MKKIGLAIVAALTLCLVGSTGCGSGGEGTVIETTTEADETAAVGASEEEYNAAMEAEMNQQGP